MHCGDTRNRSEQSSAAYILPSPPCYNAAEVTHSVALRIHQCIAVTQEIDRIKAMRQTFCLQHLGSNAADVILLQFL